VKPDVQSYTSELVVLVADLDTESTMRGLLQRWQSLGIRKLEDGNGFDILRHPQRDAGCRSGAESFLDGFVRTHGNALVVFDHQGCGWDDRSAHAAENDLERRLSDVGWAGRCAVVVIDPELEAWVWSDSPNVDAVLGWTGRSPPLRTWLMTERLLEADRAKPANPKKAMERAMRAVNKPLSPHVFTQLAATVSLGRCEDRSFLKLKRALQQWFSLTAKL